MSRVEFRELGDAQERCPSTRRRALRRRGREGPVSGRHEADPSGDPRRIRSDEARLIIVRGAGRRRARGTFRAAPCSRGPSRHVRTGPFACGVLAVLLLAGCSTRDHSNPLDPQNPDTHGNPEWLFAIADDGAVDLSWKVPTYVDLDAVRLIDAASDQVLWTGGDGRGVFRDLGLQNGVTRTYRLDLVLNSGTILGLPVEKATPGKNIPWVYDLGRGEVVRLSPDGLRRRTGYFDSATLAVVADPDSGFVLALDFFSGRILTLDRDAKERWVVENYARPNAGAFVRGGWWVSDSGLGVVRRLNAQGIVLREFSGFTFPLDVAAVGDSAVWVADATGPVSLIHLGRGIVAVDTLRSPRALAATQEGGTWVADSDADQLVRLGPTGNVMLRLDGYPGVEALAGDPLGNGVWVGDRSHRRVALLDADGNVVMSAPGFPAPSSLSVAPDGSEVWVADAALGFIVRLSRTGEVLDRSLDLSNPVSVSVAFR
jgi:hypothetical protein